jgi:sugar phosphate isomerase/epimerase
MMRIGVRAHDFPKLPVEELAARIAAQGMASVQLALNKAVSGFNLKRGDLSPGLANHVGRAFRSRGVGIAVLGCYVNPIHPDAAQRAELLGWFKEHIRFARDFGCGVVALETGSLNADYSYNPGNGGKAAFDLLVSSITELVREAERFGVIVGVEGVASHVVCTPARMRELLDAIGSPNVQVVFDPVNMLSIDNWKDQHRVIGECLELFGDRVVIVHAKDFKLEDGTLRAVRSGQGLLEHAPVVRFLKERKPYIDVLLEGASEDTVEECARVIDGSA